METLKLQKSILKGSPVAEQHALLYIELQEDKRETSAAFKEERLLRSHTCIQSVFGMFQPHPVCEGVSVTLQVRVATGETVWAGESHLSSSTC